VSIDNNSPTENDILEASNTLSDPDGIASPISYQWQRDGRDIPGATSASYITSTADAGARLTVVASFHDEAGNRESVSSGQTAPVLAAGNSAPTGSITIAGIPAEDETLTATHTLHDADGISGPVSFQWQRDGVDIAGATGESLLLDQEHVGGSFSVVARYTDDKGHDESVTSDATAPVANVNDATAGVPTIEGTAVAGGTLSANISAITDDDGIASTEIHWERSTDGGLSWSTVGTGPQYSVHESDEATQLRVNVVVLDAFAGEEQSRSLAVTIGTSNDPGDGSDEPIADLPSGFVGLTDDRISNDATADPQESDAIDAVLSGNDGRLDDGTATRPADDTGAGDHTASAPEIAESTVIEDSFTDVRYSGTSVLERLALAEQQASAQAGSVVIVEAAETTPPRPLEITPPPLPESPTPSVQPLTQRELVAIASPSTAQLEIEHVNTVMKNHAMWQDIDEMKDAVDEDARFDNEFVVRVVSTSGMGIAAAFAAYSLRGGALIASLLSSVPLWTAYDPLPILSREKREAEEKRKAEREAAAAAAEHDPVPEDVDALFK
jgi:hypothetical protein